MASTIRSREEIARYIEAQFSYSKDERWEKMTEKRGVSYGRYELKQLMDFIFDGEPLNESEIINNPSPMK